MAGQRRRKLGSHRTIRRDDGHREAMQIGWGEIRESSRNQRARDCQMGLKSDHRPMCAVARLTELNVYPVKSCRGISLTEAVLTPHGIEHDREWMIVDEAGQFVTQRTFPRLALIATELTAQALRLRATGRDALEIPFAPLPTGERPVQIWQHATTALDEGEVAAAWLSGFLGRRLRLGRRDPGRRRRGTLE